MLNILYLKYKHYKFPSVLVTLVYNTGSNKIRWYYLLNCTDIQPQYYYSPNP